MSPTKKHPPKNLQNPLLQRNLQLKKQLGVLHLWQSNAVPIWAKVWEH